MVKFPGFIELKEQTEKQKEESVRVRFTPAQRQDTRDPPHSFSGEDLLI